MKRRLALAAGVCLVVPAAVLAQDPLQGTAGDDLLAGTPAADTILGLEGNDRLLGGAGDDDLDGGPGADDIHGGAGNDAVLYGARSAALTVSLNDVADDGERGEGDNVHDDVEQIFGGAGADRLTGSRHAELIDGGAGDDAIAAGRGRDTVYAGAGNDVIKALDSTADSVDCGAGRDTVAADASDVLTGCEVRTRRARIRAPVVYTALYEGPRTRFTQLSLRMLPRGSVVTVRCRGGGCPFAARRATPRAGQTVMNLVTLLGPRELHAGATLEVRISAPRTIGRVERFVLRDGRTPRHTVLCLAPGSSRPQTTC